MRMLPKYACYFGCHREAGHYVFDPTMRHDRGQMDWLSSLDGLLPPDDPQQAEGRARLHYFVGCTLLAFWDRSVDKRPGSNSVFYIPGCVSFAEAVLEARQSFSNVWGRFKFEVVEA